MFYYTYQKQNKLSNLEINEKEITNRERKKGVYPSYPRHINNRIVLSHRGNIQSMNYSDRFLPKTCPMTNTDFAFESENNIALRVLQYQLKDRQAKQTHLENVKRSLERRLQAAKQSGNDYLVDLLQRESQQLEINIEIV